MHGRASLMEKTSQYRAAWRSRPFFILLMQYTAELLYHVHLELWRPWEEQPSVAARTSGDHTGSPL